MNAKLELWKIRLQAYNERYTALTILTLTLSSTMPKNQDDANLTNSRTNQFGGTRNFKTC